MKIHTKKTHTKPQKPPYEYLTHPMTDFYRTISPVQATHNRDSSLICWSHKTFLLLLLLNTKNSRTSSLKKEQYAEIWGDIAFY